MTEQIGRQQKEKQFYTLPGPITCMELAVLSEIAPINIIGEVFNDVIFAQIEAVHVPAVLQALNQQRSASGKSLKASNLPGLVSH